MLMLLAATVKRHSRTLADRNVLTLTPVTNDQIFNRAWILWHVPPGADEAGSEMLIGVYSSREAAMSAVERLASKPGFSDHPGLVSDTDEPGFLIVDYRLDEDHWTEGYVDLDAPDAPRILLPPNPGVA